MQNLARDSDSTMKFLRGHPEIILSLFQIQVILTFFVLGVSSPSVQPQLCTVLDTLQCKHRSDSWKIFTKYDKHDPVTLQGNCPKCVLCKRNVSNLILGQASLLHKDRKGKTFYLILHMKYNFLSKWLLLNCLCEQE